ncbi:CHAT domain-containing protein [Pseudonocardia oroxyli]|nr:CHAT domain-containing protein [Pseudonocardia oroxyli]
MTAKARFGALTTGWPVLAKGLWWVVRPGCTLVGLAASLVAVFAGPWWAGCGAALLMVVARTIRRPWLGLLAAVPAFVLVPVAGIALAARVVAGVAAVLVVGRGSWRNGLEGVAAGRRQSAGSVPTDDEARGSLSGLSSMSDDDAIEAVGTAGAAAWASADGRRIASAAGMMLSLALTGTAGPVRLPLDLDVVRLAVLEQALDMARKVVFAAAAVGLAAVLWSGWVDLAPWMVLDGGPIRASIAYALVFALAFRLSRRADRMGLLVLLLSAGLIVDAGLAGIVGGGCAAVAAVAGNAARPTVDGLVLGGPRPAEPGPGLRTGTRRGRRTWRAATEARRWESEYEACLWDEIVADPDESAALKAGALAALAEDALSRSKLQEAVRRAEEALAVAESAVLPRGLATRVHAAAGRAVLAAGDPDRARGLLASVVDERAYRTDAAVQEAWREAAHSQAGESGGAGYLARWDAARHEAARAGDLAALRDMLGTDLDISMVRDKATRAALITAQSRGHLELGELELRHGDARAAAKALRRALAGLSGPATEVERAVAHTLLGAATTRTSPDRALTDLGTGVRALEDSRGELADELHRRGLVLRHAGVYELVFDAAQTLQEQGLGSGPLAAEVVESLRRGSLATMLRAGSLDLGEPVRAVQQRIAALESTDSPDGAAELADAHRELSAQLSGLFADAYVPRRVRDTPVDPGDRHVLAFHLDDLTATRMRGHTVWTPPGRTAWIHPFDVTDSEILDLVTASDPEERRVRMSARQDDEQRGRWRALGAALLPPELRLLFRGLPEGALERVLVVPHGPLAALPWAAVGIDDGRPLLSVAEIQVVPSLALLDRPGDRPGLGTGPVAVHLAEVAARAEARTLAELPTNRAEDLGGFLDLLSTGPAGAYLATHGDGVGLAQAVTFAGGGRLSAGAALGQRWPDWVVFASCLVGRVDVDPGAEPLGLPISCMLGGARTVVGGVIEIGYGAGAQAARVAVRVARGEHPAAALRAEQLYRWRQDPSSPLTAWAGLVCLSRLGSEA